MPRSQPKQDRSTPDTRTARKPSPRASVDIAMLLTRPAGRRVVSQYRRHQVVFAQGDAADSVFYIQAGEVKLTVVSPR
jgi:CRP/FNR family transcriptional regulator, cyclic AMP receptor protein